MFDDSPQWMCGEDFCEECGDCLHCYEGDPCFCGVEHFYANDSSEPLAYPLSMWREKDGEFVVVGK